jgi:outer membrane protein assembly factor BamE (lipoprotein component of BamABCDE complex)
MNTKIKFQIVILLFFMIIGCATTSQAKAPNGESRKYYVETHPGLSPEIKQAILKGKVIEGMTKQDVLVTWGEPSRLLKYDEPDEEHGEHWYYDQPFYSFAPTRYVGFDINGIVNYLSKSYK